MIKRSNLLIDNSKTMKTCTCLYVTTLQSDHRKHNHNLNNTNLTSIIGTFNYYTNYALSDG